MTINVGILIFKDVQSLDVIGPWEVFSFWKSISKQPINLYLISEKKGYIQCYNDIVLKSHCDFKHAPQLDYFLVPGGQGRLVQSNNKTLLAFIRQQSKKCKLVLSVCTGMFLLYHAGLLKDKSVSTYWRAIPELKALERVKLIEKRVVKSGEIWSSGGVSSGIDLALEMINEVAGKKVAGQVQLLLEYFPRTKVFANKNTVKTLPAYNSNASTNNPIPPSLPEYIKNYIE